MITKYPWAAFVFSNMIEHIKLENKQYFPFRLVEILFCDSY